VSPNGAARALPFALPNTRLVSGGVRAALYEHAVKNGECLIAADGPLVCATGAHTGRAPNDKFFVREPESEGEIAWGSVNRPMEQDHFDRLRADVLAALAGGTVYVERCAAGADPRYRLPVQVVAERAWHALFARNLLIDDAGATATESGLAPFTVLAVPGFRAVPSRHGTRSDAVIAIHFGERLAIIAGTEYAGEIKKSVFTVLNYLLPFRGVLPMHCSANIGPDEDVALFFGLSGTGKTTLSSDAGRRLIGDDEHGWSERGVFNFEGGCYAKTIHLSAEAEPQIFSTTRRFGTVLENVIVDPETRQLDLDDASRTENTRAAYPLSFIDGAEPSGMGGHPRHLVMLTADAFGVLPPIARLSAEGAMYHFLSGYTAKVAGTEIGVTEPEATFSTCFGAPFMPRHPSVYGNLLKERIAKGGVDCWLVNTGWTGGKYGVGRRMPIKETRALLNAALDGSLNNAQFRKDPNFGFDVPVAVPGVDSKLLDPRGTWADPEDYDRIAAKLVDLFVDNFAQFAEHVDEGVRQAAPKIAQANPQPTPAE
jgi:phosphoenolpyruvate carboxykinase (ATP)